MVFTNFFIMFVFNLALSLYFQRNSRKYWWKKNPFYQPYLLSQKMVFFLIQFILHTFGVILRFVTNFIDKIEIYNIFSVSMIDINGWEGTKMKVVEADFRTLWTLGAKLNFTLGLMESWFGNGWTTVSVLWSFLTYFLIVFLYSVHIFCSLIFQTIVSRKVTANDGKRFFL